MNALDAPVPIGITHGAKYLFPEEKRPYIQLDIASVNHDSVYIASFSTMFLLDSGADKTVLDLTFATDLGIDWKKCVKESQNVVGGGSKDAYLSEILIRMCGRWFRIPVAFMQDQKPPILGREGVFDQMLLGFDHKNRYLFASMK